jgi:hypothetical protein
MGGLEGLFGGCGGCLIWCGLFHVIAAYLWAARFGYLSPVGDGQVRGLTTALAVILWLAWLAWLAWFFG